MFNPKITFIYDNPQEEAFYLTYIANRIANNFYQDKGLAILPYPLPDQQVVYFPHLMLFPDFWKKIAQKPYKNYRKLTHKELPTEILDYCEYNNSCSNQSNSKLHLLRKHWSEREGGIIRLSNELLCPSQTLTQITDINILQTEYGTAGSFYPIKNHKSISLFITQRNDLNINYLLRTYLLGIMRIQTNIEADENPVQWKTRTDVIEYLLNYSAFRNLLIPDSGNRPVINWQNIIRDSDQYESELGFPGKSILKFSKEGKLLLKNKQVEQIFTPQESVVLKYLLKNIGLLVSFDDLAEIIWKDQADEKFSLYALAKVIENIRKKLEAQGIYRELIHTIRGKGYIYY